MFQKFKYENLHSQPGLFLEIQNTMAEKKNYIHCQISTLNMSMLKKVGLTKMKENYLFKLFSSFIYIFQINLNSNTSNYYEIGINENEELLTTHIKDRNTKKTIKFAAYTFSKFFKKFNILLLTFFTVLSNKAKSYYIGGTLPMKSNPIKKYHTDLIGRPLKHKNLLLIVQFSSLPATTFALTIMANSSRIVEEAVLKNENLQL